MSITLQHFREILDELKIIHKVHKNMGIIEFIMNHNDPFKAYFKFIFSISEERNTIQAHGLLCNVDLDDSDDFRAAYRFCNEWHNDKIMPKVIVVEESKFLLCEWTWDTDYEISDDLLKGLILANFIKSTEQCINKALEEGVYPIVTKKSEDTKEFPSEEKALFKEKEKK